jgi:hypothetical protein
VKLPEGDSDADTNADEDSLYVQFQGLVLPLSSSDEESEEEEEEEDEEASSSADDDERIDEEDYVLVAKSNGEVD